MTRWRDFQNELTPSIPYIFLFDNGGSQSFDTSGAFHTWDNIRIKTKHFNYTADDDRIQLTVQSSGFYKVTFECSYNGVTGGATSTEIYKNGTVLNGGVVSTYCDGNQQGSETLTYIVYLEYDDYIQIKTTASANSVTSIADTSRLIIEFIPMRGWDNSAGGRTEYKGDVLR